MSGTVATHVAFVRAVMIGREGLHREVLLDMFRRAGGRGARSYIATGNVSFAAEASELAAIVERVEHDLERVLDRPTPLFVRSLAELVELVERDPFGGVTYDDVHARLVTFFRGPVPKELTVPMRSPNDDWEVFAAGHREVFSITRSRPGRQPQDPGGVIQRTAGQLVTTRTLGTVGRIVASLTGSANEPRALARGSPCGADAVSPGTS